MGNIKTISEQQKLIEFVQEVARHGPHFLYIQDRAKEVLTEMDEDW